MSKLARAGGVLCLSFFGLANFAVAAKQCLAQPGTYGAVTVTGCENDPQNGVINPLSEVVGPGYPYDGLALSGFATSSVSCTYSFSHPVLKSSITIDLDAIHLGDALSLELDGQSYAISASDIVVTPLPAESAPDVFPVSKGAIAVTGGVATVVDAEEVGSGTVQLLSDGPARISSLKLTMSMVDSSGGGVTRVCLDDAAIGEQAIQFTSTPPAPATVGGNSYTPTATGGASDNPVVFSVDPASTGVCTISGNTVSFTGVGNCVINADQAGNDQFEAAPRAQQTIIVEEAPKVPLTPQVINFTSTPPASAVVGSAPYRLAANGGASGNPVTFSVDPSSAQVCSIVEGAVTFIGVGTCTVNANQAGDDLHEAATTVQQSFTVSAAPVEQPVTPTPVPTLGEWGVIALSSLLAMFGLSRMRKRRG